MAITRRDFLKTTSLLSAWVALSACRPNEKFPDAGSGGTFDTLEPIPALPLSEDALLLHTLKRVTFGPTPEMIQRARQIGLQAFLDEQLSPETISDDSVEALLQNFNTLSMTPSERYSLERKGQPVEELVRATILRQWISQRQLYEVMVDFWSNHFNIFIGKNLCRVLKTDDDQMVIRPHALGKFQELLLASAHSPAMLVYLDQATSNGGAPNENYARELMELHTLGVEAGYTHKDVEEVARILTGWSVVPPRSLRFEPGRFIFNPRAHAGGEKLVLGEVIPPGGEEEGIQLLEVLAANPNTARFISEKLARRFVSDYPPASLIERLAGIFKDSQGDLPTILRTLFASEEFKVSAGQKFKRPLEFFVSALRMTGATATANLGGRGTSQIQDHLRLLGQVPFTWSPPNGFPDIAAYWSTTSGLLGRWNFGLLLTAGRVRGLKVDLKSLTQDAASAEDVVDVLSIRLLGKTLPEVARSILVDFASQGDLGDNLASITGLILGSPHFQMR